MSMPVRRGSTQGWIPSIFNDFFNNEWMIRGGATAPAINVFECEKKYTVEVAAPGMTKEDFAIHLSSDNNLSITMEKNCNCKNGSCENKEGEKEHEGNKMQNNEERKGRYLRREFSYTKFQQTLILPDDVDTSKIEARVNNGVLTVEIPKKTATEPKQINREISIA